MDKYCLIKIDGKTDLYIDVNDGQGWHKTIGCMDANDLRPFWPMKTKPPKRSKWHLARRIEKLEGFIRDIAEVTARLSWGSEHDKEMMALIIEELEKDKECSQTERAAHLMEKYGRDWIEKIE